jgi:hypothetical protein
MGRSREGPELRRSKRAAPDGDLAAGRAPLGCAGGLSGYSTFYRRLTVTFTNALDRVIGQATRPMRHSLEVFGGSASPPNRSACIGGSTHRVRGLSCARRHNPHAPRHPRASRSVSSCRTDRPRAGVTRCTTSGRAARSDPTQSTPQGCKQHKRDDDYQDGGGSEVGGLISQLDLPANGRELGCRGLDLVPQSANFLDGAYEVRVQRGDIGAESSDVGIHFGVATIGARFSHGRSSASQELGSAR